MEKKPDTSPRGEVISMPIDPKLVKEFEERVKQNRDGNLGDVAARR